MSIIKMFDARNVTLTSASNYFETGDPNYLFPVIGKTFEKSFLEQFAALFSEKDLKEVDFSDVARATYYNLGYNVYPALYNAITLYSKSKFTEETEAALKRLFATYEELMDKQIETMDDVEAIMERAKRYQRKYRSLKEPEKKDEDKEKRFDLETLIFSVEHVLKMQVDRKIKLFQFIPYYKNAVKIASKQKKSEQ